MTATETLQQAIQGVLTEKALSAEAISAVQSILEENKTLGEVNKSLIESAKKIADQNIKLTEENTMWKTRAAAVEQKESDVKEREFRQELKDSEVSFTNLRLQDMKEVMGLVFKNTNIRKSITSHVVLPPPTKDQYNNTVYPSASEVNDSEVITEE